MDSHGDSPVGPDGRHELDTDRPGEALRLSWVGKLPWSGGWPRSIAWDKGTGLTLALSRHSWLPPRKVAITTEELVSLRLEVDVPPSGGELSMRLFVLRLGEAEALELPLRVRAIDVPAEALDLWHRIGLVLGRQRYLVRQSDAAKVVVEYPDQRDDASEGPYRSAADEVEARQVPALTKPADYEARQAERAERQLPRVAAGEVRAVSPECAIAQWAPGERIRFSNQEGQARGVASAVWAALRTVVVAAGMALAGALLGAFVLYMVILLLVLAVGLLLGLIHEPTASALLHWYAERQGPSFGWGAPLGALIGFAIPLAKALAATVGSRGGRRHVAERGRGRLAAPIRRWRFGPSWSVGGECSRSRSGWRTGHADDLDGSWQPLDPLR